MKSIFDTHILSGTQYGEADNDEEGTRDVRRHREQLNEPKQKLLDE